MDTCADYIPLQNIIYVTVRYCEVVPTYGKPPTLDLSGSSTSQPRRVAYRTRELDFFPSLLLTEILHWPENSAFQYVPSWIEPLAL